MDGAMVSVEELDFRIRDKTVLGALTRRDKEAVQASQAGIFRPDSEQLSIPESSHKPPTQTPFEASPSKKYSTLPSIFPKKNRKTNELVSKSTDKQLSEEPVVLGQYKALNVTSLENMFVPANDDQLQQVGLKPDQRLGKKFLAPIVDPKQFVRERTNSSPAIPSKNLRQKTPTENSRAQNLLSHTGQDFEVQKPRAQSTTSYEGLLTRPKENASNSSTSNQEEKTLLAIPHLPHRRFSAPLSPRFVRRLIPEKLYSSPVVQTSESEERETRPRTPDRGSIFSPPAKEFDEIQDQKTEAKAAAARTDILQTNQATKASRAKDFDFLPNPTRFLSDIRVTFNDMPSQTKGRTKGADKRKNSYTALSPSSRALLSDEILPPVRTTLPECGQGGRSRALSTSELPFTLRNEQSNFDSPIFLDPGTTQRLSHLSLSPRLPKKF